MPLVRLRNFCIFILKKSIRLRDKSTNTNQIRAAGAEPALSIFWQIISSYWGADTGPHRDFKNSGVPTDT